MYLYNAVLQLELIRRTQATSMRTYTTQRLSPTMTTFPPGNRHSLDYFLLVTTTL